MDSFSIDQSYSSTEEFKRESDVEKLRRLWQNEKSSPEVQDYDRSIVLSVHAKVKNLEVEISKLEESSVNSLRMQLLTIDLDRVVFLLRSYLKVRLQKIENYALQICNSADFFGRLSSEEKEFAQRTVDQFQNHLEKSFLQKLPSEYSSLLREGGFDDEAGGSINMIPEAPLDSFVFCITRESVEDLQLDESGEETISWNANELFILKYSKIRNLIREGKLDLI